MPEATHLDVDEAVRDRYDEAAQSRQAALCCPVDYDPQFLSVIPQEVLDRDYGCGDPSKYVKAGDSVLDLGSGGGKICFIASQIVGKEGRVVGVDVNDEMLELAHKSAPEVASKVGYANVEFVRGNIQDLALSLDSLDAHLKEQPIQGVSDLARLDDVQARLRADQPLIPSDSIDIVVSNCVLNLVRSEHKGQLIQEIFRVLKRGGRIAISDIVSDEDIPVELQNDPELWSGCISGAFQEIELLRELEATGFYGIEVDVWTEEPFAVVEGIEFRSLTVTARKGKEGECFEANHAVVYRGPWSEVRDDDGHVLKRGERTAVCAKTFEIFTQEPYVGHVVGIAPKDPTSEGERAIFDCSRSSVRDPKETKGGSYSTTSESGGCC